MGKIEGNLYKAAEFQHSLRREGDSNSWYSKPVRQFSKLLV